MTTVQVPVSLGGTNTPYTDDAGSYGMASRSGYGYQTYLMPMLSEVMAACASVIAAANAIQAGDVLLRTNNLSELTDKGVARTNLGLGPMATMGGGYTFAQMKALVGMADGDVVRVTNYGKGGSYWRYSSSMQDWFPTAPCLVYESRTLITGLVQTAAQALLAIPIEAGLLKNKVVRLRFSPAKNGSTDTMLPELHFGAAGSVADQKINGTYSGPSGANIAGGVESWFLASDSVTLQRIGGQINGAFNGSVYSLATFQATTVNDLGVANFLTIACTMSGTTNAPQLGYVSLEILP